MAKSKPQSRKSPQTSSAQVVLKVLGVQAFLVAVGLAIWLAGRYSDGGSSWDAKASADSHRHGGLTASRKRDVSLPLALGSFAAPAPGDADPHGTIAESDFSRAFDRLDKALRSHTGASPDRLLAEVNAKAGACPIIWNSGEPSLTVGDRLPGALNLSSALNRCAEAVEKVQ